jgi:hypothetical protein
MELSPMGFLNVAMLLGLAAVAIPPIIHLLNRRRYDIIDWGAMQFLQISEVTRRRILIEEVLLMALRMGLIAILVLALAAPFTDDPVLTLGLFAGVLTALAVGVGVGYFLGLVRGGSAGLSAGVFVFAFIYFTRPESVNDLASKTVNTSPNRDVVVIFDGSASMTYKPGDQSTQEKAQEWATNFVNGLKPGDGVALVVARKQPVLLVPKLTTDRVRVRDQVQRLPPPGGGADMARAIQTAHALLEESERAERDIIVVSDGQRHGWADARSLLGWEDFASKRDASAPIKPRLWCVNLDPNRTKEVSNWSLAPLVASRAVVSVNQEVLFRTSILLAGPTKYEPPYEISVQVDHKEVKKLTPPPAEKLEGGQVPLRFDLKLSKPGSHLVSVVITPDPPRELREPGYVVKDSLPLDNRRDFSLEVVEALPVLLVDGNEKLHEKPKGEKDGSDFLRIALAPEDTISPVIKAKVVSVAEFNADHLRDQTPNGLEGKDKPRVLILCNVAKLTPTQQQAVETFLQQGGGVLVTLGDRADADVYNRQFYREGRGWLPARLLRVLGDQDQVAKAARPLTESFFHPALELFRRSSVGGLDVAYFTRWWKLAPPDNEERGVVIARLDKADAPLFLEGRRGEGRVIVCAVPLDNSWRTNLVSEQVPAFTPLAHELIHYLAGTRATEHNLDPGQPLRYRLAQQSSTTGYWLLPPPQSEEYVAKSSQSEEEYRQELAQRQKDPDGDPAKDAEGVKVLVRKYEQKLEALRQRLGRPLVSDTEDDSAGYPARVVEQAQGRLLIHEGMREPGVWAVLTPERELVYYAVQPDQREADLTPADEADREKVGKHVAFAYKNDVGDLLKSLSQERNRQEFWWWFLLGVVALLCGEVWLTRRIVKNRA